MFAISFASVFHTKGSLASPLSVSELVMRARESVGRRPAISWSDAEYMSNVCESLGTVRVCYLSHRALLYIRNVDGLSRVIRTFIFAQSRTPRAAAERVRVAALQRGHARARGRLWTFLIFIKNFSLISSYARLCKDHPHIFSLQPAKIDRRWSAVYSESPSALPVARSREYERVDDSRSRNVAELFFMWASE